MQFSTVLQGITNPGVQWSLNPNVGTLVNGVYTAPSWVTADTQVIITATSLSNPSASGTATVSILQPVTPVSISLSAGGTSLTAGQSVNLTASVTGTTNTGVSWQLTPSVGTISNGVYSAPTSVNAQQNVVVTATSQADPTKSASVTLLLKPVSTPNQPAPTVGITLSQASASLYASQSVTFTATVSGTSNTSVTWSLNPQVGQITNGVYQAPSMISAQQTVTVTATSAANSAKTASAVVTLVPVAITLSPGSAILNGGQSATFTPTVSGTSNTAVNWSLNPAVGTLTNGVYTAPASVASAQQVAITATSLADSTKSATASVSLTPSSSSSSGTSSSTVTLPVEVMGPAGTTASVSVTVPSGSNLAGPLNLWMQIHGLKYDTEASVQVNNSAWMPISTGNVTLLGNAAAFGGIGGGFHTLQLTMNLPAGTVVAGNNTITFQFNGTNGVVSGYRVLAFNIQSQGNNLIPSSQFVEDDPNNWQPPSSAASDIAAGQALYQGAALTVPTSSGGTAPIQAHCSDCHTQDGRDLKYFNYSNHSIEVRSIFHGLTAQQGAQIASYIRSLDLPNPGRPWNPPYQPGPGLDSQPVENWSGGAGLAAVLDNDSEALAYLAPGGSTAGFAANAYLNPRETPIVLQLPDWNSWLPVVHPMDSLGATFTNSTSNQLYSTIRTQLQPSPTPQVYWGVAINSMTQWFEAIPSLWTPLINQGNQTNWAGNTRSELYSIGLWEMVKMWEINQDFGLEGMPQAVFSKPDLRAWYGASAFNTAPNFMHVPAGPGIGNGSAIAEDYLTTAWYQVQLVLNDGQGGQSGHSPVDYGYVIGNLYAFFSVNAGVPGIMLQLEDQIKSLQEFTLSGVGPQSSTGFHLIDTSPMWLVDFNNAGWSATPPATEATLIQAYTQAWFNQVSQYTPQEIYQGGWATATENPATDLFNTTFGGGVWYMLPRLRWVGVDPSLTDQISAWAAQIWPLGNWALNNSATCSGPQTASTCTSD